MKTYPLLSTAISNVIETLRRERKMSKTALSDFACLERRYLFDIEQEKKRPTVNTIFLICDALQVHPVVFFQRVTQEIELLKSTEFKNNIFT